jgi:uncharacterized membrane protein
MLLTFSLVLGMNRHEKAFMLSQMTKNRGITMTIESSKNLGGIGAILLFVGILPYINYFGIVEIIGAILVLVALHGIGSYYKDSEIFNNALYGIIAGIVGVVTAIVIGIAIVLPSITDFIMKIYPSWNGDWSTLSSLSGMTPEATNITFSDVVPFITAALVILVVLWVFAIIAAFLLRRSLRLVSAKSATGLFSTAGLLLLIGAVLTIIGIGVILIWIAMLILAIAFFTMKTSKEQPVYTPTSATTPPPTPV